MSLKSAWLRSTALRACVALGGVFAQRAWVRRRIDAALQQNGADAHAWATLAHWCAEGNELFDARLALERCVDLLPQQAMHWFNLGFVCERMGCFSDSEMAFRRATDLDPTLDRAWYGLALALIAQDRLAEAAPALRINTQLQPMSPSGWYQLARVQFDLGALEEVRGIVHRLRQFEPKVAAQLARETGL